MASNRFLICILALCTLGLASCAQLQDTPASGLTVNRGAQWRTVQDSGPGPIRSIVRRKDGLLLGPASSGHRIDVWSSRDEGATWSLHGSIASNHEVDFGDPMMLALPDGQTIFCAFREFRDGKWRVTVSRSDNGGDDWVYDSTIVGPVEPFVGAPFLHLANNGDLQIYYDSELLAAQHGAPGHQWIAMQGRRGTTGPWNAYGVVTASRMLEPGALSREGMPTVVSLGGDRILLVTEAVEPFPSGHSHANQIHAIQSWDGGRTWDHSLRQVVYRGRIDGATGRRFNAYVPYARRVGNGPVGVAFCTDEDFPSPPDLASTQVLSRRCHVKYVQTTSNFESWSGSETIWAGRARNYTPGLFELSPNDMLLTIDQLGAGMRIMRR